MRRRAFSWMFAWLLMAGAAGAQQGTSEVRGRGIDSTGASLPGVTVIDLAFLHFEDDENIRASTEAS